MLRKERFLVGAAIALGAVDLVIAYGVYVKKKGLVIRDMALKSIEDLARGDQKEESEAYQIPIE